jgi:ubiquinone/menaquinone biosynthesis C-methylase UbiE
MGSSRQVRALRSEENSPPVFSTPEPLLPALNADEFARILYSDERRRWQDPVVISKAVGVREGMTVADLACGPGFFTLPLASLVGEGGTVYAVDSHLTMLEHLRSNMARSAMLRGRIKILCADVLSTGIPSGSVDIALFANVLHDIDDKGTFLSEVKRICRPGATVVGIDWKKVRTEMGPPFEIRLAEAECRRILSESGLEVMSTIDPGPHHYGLVARFRGKGEKPE